MLPPEALRIVLLIGLAATGYLMIQAWNTDYVSNQETVTYSEAPALADGGSQAPISAVPDAPPPVQTSDSAAGGDIPDESLLSDGAESEAPASQPAAAVGADRLVTVFTPTLKLWIDRLGGDIVRVQLPKYPLELENPDQPYLLVENGGGHTYVVQSGLMGEDGVDKDGRPLYTAENGHFELAEGESADIVLRAERDGQMVSKVFSVNADSYLVDMRYRVENRLSRPITAALFAQIKRDGKEPIIEESFALGPQSYLGGAITTPEERYFKLEFDELDEAQYQTSVEGGWVAFLQHYFITAWIPPADATYRYYGNRRGADYVFGFVAPRQTVAAGETGEWHSSFYAGPKDQHRLEEIAPNLNLTVDYGFLWWLAVPLFDVLAWLHGLVGNWGWAIILLTVIVKILLYPLFNISYKSMAKMRKLAPELKRLQERYADDRQRLSSEMMKLYQKEGANPLGGCLPMLLPMPVFIALYWVLWESVELRHAPFMLWIQDLSAMDQFFVLPLLMGGTMYLQQLMSPAMGDPMQQRMMRMMPIMFTVLFLFFPAGLVLYWLVNSVLSVAQQWYVTRQAEAL